VSFSLAAFHARHKTIRYANNIKRLTQPEVRTLLTAREHSQQQQRLINKRDKKKHHEL